MPLAISIDVLRAEDEAVLRRLAQTLRANDAVADDLRDLADSLESDQQPDGLQFAPQPGRILICRFSPTFRKPEAVKTRPVLVISAKRKDAQKLCTVVAISSHAPNQIRPYHMKLPQGLLPGDKYEQAWIKGDLINTVGCQRLDRIKFGVRDYRDIIVPSQVLMEARRCVLHALGMHALTEHWH